MARFTASAGWATTAINTALEFARKSSNLPVGAVLGLAAGIALTGILYYTPGRVVPLWLLTFSIPFCIATGVGVERLLHWKFGWKFETDLRRARIKHETDLKLIELRERLTAGVLSPEESQRIGARIAREGLLGPARPRAPRKPKQRRV